MDNLIEQGLQSLNNIFDATLHNLAPSITSISQQCIAPDLQLKPVIGERFLPIVRYFFDSKIVEENIIFCILF